MHGVYLNKLSCYFQHGILTCIESFQFVISSGWLNLFWSTRLQNLIFSHMLAPFPPIIIKLNIHTKIENQFKDFNATKKQFFSSNPCDTSLKRRSINLELYPYMNIQNVPPIRQYPIDQVDGWWTTFIFSCHSQDISYLCLQHHVSSNSVVLTSLNLHNTLFFITKIRLHQVGHF